MAIKDFLIRIIKANNVTQRLKQKTKENGNVKNRKPCVISAAVKTVPVKLPYKEQTRTFINEQTRACLSIECNHVRSG